MFGELWGKEALNYICSEHIKNLLQALKRKHQVIQRNTFTLYD